MYIYSSISIEGVSKHSVTISVVIPAGLEPGQIVPPPPTVYGWVTRSQHTLDLCTETSFVQSSSVSKKISNDQELIQSDPISCPQNQKGNN